jgi:hypothetical protein
MPDGLLIAASLPQAEEAALNVLLHRAAGDAEGMPLYRISWAARDNARVVPICFHEVQGSYHLLSWEPPTTGLLGYEREMKEDFSRGTYACILHFVDPQTKEPFNPTTTLMENIIPRLKEMRKLAEAGRRGYQATVERGRADKIAAERDRQKAEERRYDQKADEVLADASDRAAHDTQRLDVDTRRQPDQPDSFALSSKYRKPLDLAS